MTYDRKEYKGILKNCRRSIHSIRTTFLSHVSLSYLITAIYHNYNKIKIVMLQLTGSIIDTPSRTSIIMLHLVWHTMQQNVQKQS